MSSFSKSLRRALVNTRDSVRAWTLAARSDLLPSPTTLLYDFSAPSTYDHFTITTDRVLRDGRTTATFSRKLYEGFAAGVFSGLLDGGSGSGGFASVRTKPEGRVHSLRAYAALELRVKGDGRPYILNVKCADFPAEALWQTRLVAPAGVWRTLAVPWEDMMLTRRGKVELVQERVNSDAVDGVGILVADGGDGGGPFKLEVQWVRAVRYFDRALYDDGVEQVLQEVGRLEGGGGVGGVAAGRQERESEEARARRLARERAKLG